jgi:hypothetical protein
MMLLEDVFIIENLQVLNEGKTGPMKVRGVFQRADEENNNKRIYPKELLCREIEKLEESMKNRRLMGELDHPQHDSVKLSQVSHLITKLEAKGNEIIGEAEILDTPMGKVARALIEGGVQIGISSRGMGTLSEGQDGKRYVNEDFRLITWDLVADPSTRGAFPSLAESRQSVLVEEIMNDILPRVTKEKVFTTLLRDRLDEAKVERQRQSEIDEALGALAKRAAFGAARSALRGAEAAGRAGAAGARAAGRTLQSGGGVKKSLKSGASAALGSAAKSASDAASRNQKTSAQRKAGVTQTLKAKKYTGSVKKHLQGLGTAAKKAVSSKFYKAKSAVAGAASKALGSGAARLATENTSMLKLKGLLKEQGNPYGAKSEQAIKDRIKAVGELRKRMVAQGKSPQEIAAAVAKASEGK